MAHGADLATASDDERALAILTGVDGVSNQEPTVRAIQEEAFHRLRKNKIRTLSASARERYADLLDRLGK